MSGIDTNYTAYQNDTFGSDSKNTRTRRRINQQIEIRNLDSNSGKKRGRQSYDRNSSNEKSDYNVDDSENDEGPTISKHAATFNQPINQKHGRISSINAQEDQNWRKEHFNNELDGNKLNENNRDDRPSDLVEFQTPIGLDYSPIGYSSTQAKLRRNNYPQEGTVSVSESEDDLRYLGVQDENRGRNKDVSPHNRHARPRSS